MMKLVALLAVLAIAISTPAQAASVSLSRSSRPVTDLEIADGAPAGGFVHEFFVTSDTDLLCLGGVAIDAPLFHHTLGSDVARPLEGAVAAAPALDADSFITLPGSTQAVGGGFSNAPGDHAWFDVSDDGPQQNFLFARLTTAGTTGSFSGSMNLRGYSAADNAGYVSLPFQFALPSVQADFALLNSEPTYSLEYSSEPLPQPTPPPAPPVAPPAPPIAGPVGPPPAAPVNPPIGDPGPPAGLPGGLAEISMSRHTRAVTAEEIAGGAPAGGYVHEFFVSSDTDLLVVGDVEVTAPIFQHTLGSDVAASSPESAALDPALAADSFVQLPGTTQNVGGGLAGGPGDQAWFDVTDDGAQEDFLFARLTTTGESGKFSGNMNVRGYDGVVSLPFDFALPGTEADLALLASEAAPSLEYSLDPPPVAPVPPAPAPEPTDPQPTQPPFEPEVPPSQSPAPTDPIVADPPATPTDPEIPPTDPTMPTIALHEQLIYIGGWPIHIHAGFEVDLTTIDASLIDASSDVDLTAWSDRWRLLNAADSDFANDGVVHLSTSLSLDQLTYRIVQTNSTTSSDTTPTALVYRVLNVGDAANSLIPEPSTLALSIAALVALASARRGRLA